MTESLDALNRYDREIMSVLDEVSGTTTGDVARHVSTQSSNRRRHSAFVRLMLLDLEHKGFVGRLDDQKPVCWVKKVGEINDSAEPTP